MAFRYYSEKAWPLVVAILLTIAFYVYMPNDYSLSKDSYFGKLIDRSLTISGMLLGFFLTIYTILPTINNRRMKWLKDAGAYNRLIKYLLTAIIWHIVNISLVLFLPILEKLDLYKGAEDIAFGILFFVIIFSWTLSLRFAGIFVRIPGE